MSGAAGARRYTAKYLMQTSENIQGRPGLSKAALFGLCPRCDAHGLFTGNAPRIRFAEHCANCTLDYSNFNVGDGPAALLIIPISTLIIIFAMILQAAAHPPFWVHAVIWIPVTTLLTFISIRFTKAALLILEYRRGAGEVRQTGEGKPLS